MARRLPKTESEVSFDEPLHEPCPGDDPEGGLQKVSSGNAIDSAQGPSSSPRPPPADAVPIRAPSYHTGGSGSHTPSGSLDHTGGNKQRPPPYQQPSPANSNRGGGGSSYGAGSSHRVTPVSSAHRKTQMCATVAAGAICGHGIHCKFAHTEAELQTASPVAVRSGAGTPHSYDSAQFHNRNRNLGGNSSNATCDDGGRNANALEGAPPLPSFLANRPSAQSTPVEKKPSSLQLAFGGGHTRSPSNSLGSYSLSRQQGDSSPSSPMPTTNSASSPPIPGAVPIRGLSNGGPSSEGQTVGSGPKSGTSPGGTRYYNNPYNYTSGRSPDQTSSASRQKMNSCDPQRPSVGSWADEQEA